MPQAGPNLANPRDLRRQARLYEQAAKKLYEAADILDGGGQSASAAAGPERGSSSGGPQARRGSRLPQLQAILREHGPLPRGEIVERSGMPKGTVAYWLKPEHGFEQDEEGRWRLAGEPSPSENQEGPGGPPDPDPPNDPVPETAIPF